MANHAPLAGAHRRARSSATPSRRPPHAPTTSPLSPAAPFDLPASAPVALQLDSADGQTPRLPAAAAPTFDLIDSLVTVLDDPASAPALVLPISISCHDDAPHTAHHHDPTLFPQLTGPAAYPASDAPAINPDPPAPAPLRKPRAPRPAPHPHPPQPHQPQHAVLRVPDAWADLDDIRHLAAVVGPVPDRVVQGMYDDAIERAQVKAKEKKLVLRRDLKRTAGEQHGSASEISSRREAKVSRKYQTELKVAIEEELREALRQNALLWAVFKRVRTSVEVVKREDVEEGRTAKRHRVGDE